MERKRFEDECEVEEILYFCEKKTFSSRNCLQRNNDFYLSQKEENEELDRLLELMYFEKLEYKKIKDEKE